VDILPGSWCRRWIEHGRIENIFVRVRGYGDVLVTRSVVSRRNGNKRVERKRDRGARNADRVNDISGLGSARIFWRRNGRIWGEHYLYAYARNAEGWGGGVHGVRPWRFLEPNAARCDLRTDGWSRYSIAVRRGTGWFTRFGKTRVCLIIVVYNARGYARWLYDGCGRL